MASKRAKQYWLVKSEPFKYSWDEFLKDGWTYWDGVRNYQARNNLKGMRKGDGVLYYHSNEGLAVVGVARVVKEAYQDPTTDDPRWVVVDLEPVETLKRPVTLPEIKQDPNLRDMALIRQSRLSVMPVSEDEYHLIVPVEEGSDDVAPEETSPLAVVLISNEMSVSGVTAVQISWAEQRRLLKTREKASPKGCSGDQVAALDKIEIMLLSQLGLHSRQ